jgi:hypothetical protein
LVFNIKLVWAANGQDQDSQINKVKSNKIRLVLEYNYKVTWYDKPIKVDLLKKRNKDVLDSPLNTLRTYFSAMSAGDYDWFYSCWDNESKEEMLEKNLNSGKDEKFWQEAWQKFMKGRILYVDAEVKTGEFIFLKYRLTDIDGKKVTTNSIPFKLSDGKWFATSELAEDPVLNYWDVPELHTQTRVVR